MKADYDKDLERFTKKIGTMDDKELRRFVAELYFGMQSAPVLMDFLIHKGIINRTELKEYCLKKLREAK